ncbi:hypothetical protein BK129_03105 [Paenibacillus amylolyticus]|uniref:hypothetical protein n=1 Tax=Paenibacillus amylolyticus TaxID=1451 RepID=UPI00096EA297|nr:hypothetical protein [Paenibacillus amylolyticus]OMF09840.1 hypothetical protein BK129_03105 [Paenibacillus amylolyticus]
MAVPATTGQLREKLFEMEIGDYIMCRALRGSTIALTSIYYLGDVPVSSSTEIPYSGLGSTAGVSGLFYFVKVDKGVLIADRVIFNSITWDQINSKKWIEGEIFESGVIRSLSGGALYSDSNGKKSNADLGFGAFPSVNEWDKYIIKFPTSMMLSDKKLDDIFHYLSNYTWCKETPIYGTWKDSTGNTTTSASNTQRVGRGSNTRVQWGNINYAASSGSYATWGFRPVFEYKEV